MYTFVSAMNRVVFLRIATNFYLKLRNTGVKATGIFLFNTAVFQSTLGPSCHPNGYGGKTAEA